MKRTAIILLLGALLASCAGHQSGEVADATPLPRPVTQEMRDVIIDGAPYTKRHKVVDAEISDVFFPRRDPPWGAKALGLTYVCTKLMFLTPYGKTREIWAYSFIRRDGTVRETAYPERGRMCPPAPDDAAMHPFPELVKEIEKREDTWDIFKSRNRWIWTGPTRIIL
ncbi:MAG: hypothetical protein LBR29_04470 [Methylobacteriaceae bacterium]|jgi:hypothetical protein|nr:hypothetical protein [Methylobacteriaceae bacterium]